jgi:hypothetical protein
MLWKSRGRLSLHSIEDGMCGLAIMDRCDANASQIITINISKAANEIVAPNDETTFHLVNASG